MTSTNVLITDPDLATHPDANLDLHVDGIGIDRAGEPVEVRPRRHIEVFGGGMTEPIVLTSKQALELAEHLRTAVARLDAIGVQA